MGMNKDLIGKQYPKFDYDVTAEATKAYANAYNEDNPWFHDEGRGGGIIAPPLFGVVFTALGIANAFFDPDLNVNFMMLVHGEQDMSFLAPVRPGDKITNLVRIQDIQEKSSGELMILGFESTNQDNIKVLTGTSSFFVRSGSGGKKSAPPEIPDRGEPVFEATMKIDEDQTFRYAEASGDHNPIHVDDNAAKMAGLPGKIVHGLCSMAFSSKAVIDNYLGGDPTRLKRFKVRFSRPVLPGQEITTTAWMQDKSGDLEVLCFETKNPEGIAVLKDGIAEVAP